MCSNTRRQSSKTLTVPLLLIEWLCVMDLPPNQLASKGFVFSVAPAKAFRKTLKDGHCADIGYTVAEGTQTINVPDAGDVTISWFKQAFSEVSV